MKRENLLFLLLVVFLFHGCSLVSFAPYRIDTTSVEISIDNFQVFDIDNDGIDEIITCRYSDAKTPRINILAAQQNQFIEQINIRHGGRVSVRFDPVLNEALFSVTYEKDYKIIWDEYNIKGDLLRSIDVCSVQDNDGSELYDGFGIVTEFRDLNGDGKVDFLMIINGSYDKLPRDIIAMDIESGRKLWDIKTANCINQIYQVEMDGDPEPEFVATLQGTRNDVEFEDYSDQEAYLLYFDNLGNVLRRDKIGDGFTSVKIGYVGDIDNDGRDEVLFLKRNHQASKPEPDGFFLIDAATGNKEHYISTETRYALEFWQGDFNRDGEENLVAVTRNGEVHLYDSSLKIIKRSINFNDPLVLLGVTEFDANGQRKILLRRGTNELIALDSNLNLNAARVFPVAERPLSMFMVSQKNRQTMNSRTLLYSMGQGLFEVSYSPSHEIITFTAAAGGILLILTFLLASLVVLWRKNKKLGEKVETMQLILQEDRAGDVVFINNNFYIEHTLTRSIALPDERQLTRAESPLPQRLISVINKLKSSGKDEVTEEIVIPGENQQERPVSLSVRKSMSSKGDLLGFLASIKHESVDSEKIALETVRLGQDLFHNMKSPLSAQKVFIRHLKSRAKELKDSEQLLDTIDQLEQANIRIEKMSADFLSLSKIVDARFADININDMLREAVQEVKRANLKQINFEVELDSGLPQIEGDYDKLYSLVYNLLSNAIKAVSAGGNIIIRSELNRVPEEDGSLSEYFCLSVLDDGCGIQNLSEKKMFEAGYSGFPEGAGLGLAFCKKYADLHHGEIRFSNRQSGGTHVLVKIPISQAM